MYTVSRIIFCCRSDDLLISFVWNATVPLWYSCNEYYSWEWKNKSLCEEHTSEFLENPNSSSSINWYLFNYFYKWVFHLSHFWVFVICNYFYKWVPLSVFDYLCQWVEFSYYSISVLILKCKFNYFKKKNSLIIENL